MTAPGAGRDATEAAQAHAALLALMSERRGRGLDLASLLRLRHLSRVCSWSCRRPACLERSLQLEGRAQELYAQSGTAPAGEIAYLERRILKLLGELEFCLRSSALAA